MRIPFVSAAKDTKSEKISVKPSEIGPAWLRTLLFFLLALCLGAALTVAVESVCTGSAGKMRTWALKYSDSFLLTTVLYGAVISVLGALSGRLWVGGIFAAVSGLALALVDYFKLAIDGAPLVLADFGLADRAGAVAGVAGSLWPPGIFWQSVFDLLLCIVLLWRLDPLTRLRGRSQIARFIVSLIVCVFLFSGTFAKGVGDLFQVDVITRLDPASSHSTYGLTISLWRDRFLQNKQPPEGYGPEFMQNILQRIDTLLDTDRIFRTETLSMPEIFSAADTDSIADTIFPVTDNTAPVSDTQPNIIMILSESFFDVTRLPGISYDQDPAANFHALQSESISGHFFSHYLGYGTGYIEMAMQTGISGPDLGAATNICFMDEDIYRRLDSLPRQFTKSGLYAAEMLHAYDNTLYNRTVTYPLLGYSESFFERDLLDMDFPFPGSQFDGYYMKDTYLFQALMLEMQKINDTGKRAFLYAITMGNHQPYRADKFGGRCQVNASGRLLNDEEMGIFRAGLEGIVLADQALAELTDTLREYPEPVIVVFFGDHRPTLAMPDGETVYTHLGITPGSDTTAWTAEQLGEVYSTDYLIWANDPALLQGRAGTTHHAGVLSLGCDLLRLTNQPVSRYWALLELASRVGLSNTETYFVNALGLPFRNRMQAGLSDTDEEILCLRECVLYDAVYGGQYITSEMNLPPG